MHALTKLLMGSAKRPWVAGRLVCLLLLSILSLVFLSRRVSVQLPLDLPTPPLQLAVGQPSGEFGPDFAACDRPARCGPESLRSNYLLDCLKFANRTARGISERGRPPAIVQIGVASFSSKARFTDLDLFSKALAQLSPLLRATVRLVFVEPNEHYHMDIEKNTAKLRLAPSQVQIIHGMVFDTCERPKIDMYRFSVQAERDFGVPFSIYASWLGTEKTLPVMALGGYSQSTALDKGVLLERWRRFNSAANRSEYVEEIQIPCLTPVTLLSKAEILASDVAMMVIDAEGSDFRIVGRLLEFEDFVPGYLQFECVGTVWFDNNALKHDVQKLRGRGYKVGATYGHGRDGSDENNCIAVRVR